MEPWLNSTARDNGSDVGNSRTLETWSSSTGLDVFRWHTHTTAYQWLL